MGRHEALSVQASTVILPFPSVCADTSRILSGVPGNLLSKSSFRAAYSFRALSSSTFVSDARSSRVSRFFRAVSI